MIEGRLLAGAYPGHERRAEAERKLSAYLDAGVTCFVDLTEEAEGPPLHPYSALLRRLARPRSVPVTYLRLPIRDVNVPTTWRMRATLQAIRLAHDAGEVVYVHCWGGVGRTGTVVGCLLVEDGVRHDAIIERLAALRAGTTRAHRSSPETPEQLRFVREWPVPP